MGEASQFSVDLRTVEKQQRKARWSEWVRDAFTGFEVTQMSASQGSARGVALADAKLWHVCSPRRVALQSRAAARPADRTFITLQLSGAHAVVRQKGAISLQPGQLSIARSSGDIEVVTESASSHLFLDLPTSAILGEHPGLMHEQTRVVLADEPGITLLRELMLSTLVIAPRLDAMQRRITLTAMVQMLGVPFARLPPAERPEWRVQRALADIERLLHDERLDAGVIAQCQGISRRRLDALFMKTIDMTVSARIASRRMARATELLIEPESAELTITEIAFSVGFQDAAHFSRAFKAYFDMSPKAWRALHGPRAPR